MCNEQIVLIIIKIIRNCFPPPTTTTPPPPFRKNFPDVRHWSKVPEAARRQRRQPMTAPNDASKVVFTQGRLHMAARVEKRSSATFYSNLNYFRKMANVAMCQYIFSLQSFIEFISKSPLHDEKKST